MNHIGRRRRIERKWRRRIIFLLLFFLSFYRIPYLSSCSPSLSSLFPRSSFSLLYNPSFFLLTLLPPLSTLFSFFLHYPPSPPLPPSSSSSLSLLPPSPPPLLLLLLRRVREHIVHPAAVEEAETAYNIRGHHEDLVYDAAADVHWQAVVHLEVEHLLLEFLGHLGEAPESSGGCRNPAGTRGHLPDLRQAQAKARCGAQHLRAARGREAQEEKEKWEKKITTLALALPAPELECVRVRVRVCVCALNIPTHEQIFLHIHMQTAFLTHFSKEHLTLLLASASPCIELNVW